MELEAQTWFNYKQHNTWKALVGISNGIAEYFCKFMEEKKRVT